MASECEDRRQRAVTDIIWLLFLHMFSMFLCLDAKTLVMLRRFNGDTGRFSTHNAKAMLLMMGSALLLSPAFALLSEARGRKSLLTLGAAWGLGLRVAELAAPRPGVMFFTSAAAAVSQSSMLGAQSMIADLFDGDPKAAGGAMAATMMGPALAMIAAPSLGSSLALCSVRLPLALAVVVNALELVLERRLPETLPSAERIPFARADFRKLNPFTFVRVFVRGPRLAALAVAQFIGMCCEPQLTARTASLVYQESHAWTIAQCGRYSSISGIIGIPGMAAGGRGLKIFGARIGLFLGGCAAAAHAGLDAFWVKQPWQQFAIAPLMACRGVSIASLKALLQEAGTEAGMRQGELQGALASLQNVAMVLAGPLWATWYAKCLRAGRPRDFFKGSFVAMAVHVVAAQLAAATPGHPQAGDQEKAYALEQ